MKKLTKTAMILSSAVAMAGIQSELSAAVIAGSDFSDAAVFGAAGGAYDVINVDDLNPDDNVSVSGWITTNPQADEGNLTNFDANSLAGMSTDQVTKINGISGQALPIIGEDPSSFATVGFTIDIPAGTTVDLSSVTFDYRMATGGATNVRWIGFSTSLDSGVTFADVGLTRPSLESANIDLSGAAYQGLTDTSVAFNWYAGGSGSGDMDFDLVVVNGTVTTVPEPTTAGLMGLGALSLLLRRRR